MKFINYLESITGISVYPLASLIIFTVFFAVVSIWVFRTRKSFMEHMSNIPLDDKSTVYSSKI